MYKVSNVSSSGNFETLYMQINIKTMGQKKKVQMYFCDDLFSFTRPVIHSNIFYLIELTVSSRTTRRLKRIQFPKSCVPFRTHHTMDKVQNLFNPKSNTTSSEPFYN